MYTQNTMDRLYETTAIPLCLADKTGHIIFNAPAMDIPLFPEKFVHLCLQDFELQNRSEESPMVMMFEPSFFIGTAKLDADNYLIIGPVSPLLRSQSEVIEFCGYAAYPGKLFDLCNIINQTPVMPYRRFISTMSIAIQLLTGRTIPIDAITFCNNTVQHKEAEIEMTKQLFSQREHLIAHTSTSYELGVMDAIESGDEHTLARRLIEPITGRVGQMSKNLLTQEKYTFISFITMVTRAAIRGGLSPEIAFNLSDSYCQQMDELGSIQDIPALTYAMALDFCARVAEEDGGTQYSSAVKKCLGYISQHLHENIRLSDLAAITGLCNKVVSRKFKKETGYSLPDYIHRQKMNEAKYLLKHTEYSVLDICTYLQYNSQSYFIKIFREVYGTTPQQYRDAIGYRKLT